MARRTPSSISRLPPQVRELIGKLRQQGNTIDAILEHLRGMDVEVSRSALGRHVQRMAQVSERMRRSREIATALVAKFGDEPDNRVARLNIELMHGAVMQILSQPTDGDGESGPVTLAPEEAMFLARAIKELATAQKTDTDRQLKLRQEVSKAAANAATKVARARGVSKDTVEAITHAVLGIGQ